MTQSERKWNLMWDMWVAGNAEYPYAELMEYESEVNNGGHSQYFFNVANCADLKAAVEMLLPILPEPLAENLRRGYEAFAAQEDIWTMRTMRCLKNVILCSTVTDSFWQMCSRYMLKDCACNLLGQ